LSQSDLTTTREPKPRKREALSGGQRVRAGNGSFPANSIDPLTPMTNIRRFRFND